MTPYWLCLFRVLRFLLGKAKDMYLRDYGEEMYALARFFGEAVDVTNVGVKHCKHFGADGAPVAQKGARLMGERKKFELQACYSPQQLATLSPSDRYKLFWYVALSDSLRVF